MSQVEKARKLSTLAEYEGFDDTLPFLEAMTFDSVAAGICVNPDCDYTTEVEPDSETGWCESCESNTVVSGLILGGIM
jgi:hypothetical protein